MTTVKTDVVLLHAHPEYLNTCSDLLNKQWKRSFSARAQSLDNSHEDLPDSLLLLEENDGEMKVIGHSRLVRVLEDENGCWIGSVLVDEGKRNKGYGKYLMKKTEEYAQKLNFSTVYLNTHDKQGFYEHLGYTYCKPVSPINFKSNNMLKMNMLRFTSSDVNNTCLPQQSRSSQQTQYINSINIQDNVATSVPPIPPPPPPLTFAPSLLNKNLGQYWMKKSL